MEIFLKNVFGIPGHSFYADPGTFLWNQSAVNTGISISLGIIIFYIIIQMLFVVGDGLKNLLDKFITKTEKGRSLSNMEGLTHLTNSVMEAIIKFGNKNDEKRSQGKEN